MICPNCGTENSDQTPFCVNCGTPLASAEPPPQAPWTGGQPPAQQPPWTGGQPPATAGGAGVPPPYGPPPTQQFTDGPRPPRGPFRAGLPALLAFLVIVAIGAVVFFVFLHKGNAKAVAQKTTTSPTTPPVTTSAPVTSSSSSVPVSSSSSSSAPITTTSTTTTTTSAKPTPPPPPPPNNKVNVFASVCNNVTVQGGALVGVGCQGHPTAQPRCANVVAYCIARTSAQFFIKARAHHAVSGNTVEIDLLNFKNNQPVLQFKPFALKGLPDQTVFFGPIRGPFNVFVGIIQVKFNGTPLAFSGPGFNKLLFITA